MLIASQPWVVFSSIFFLLWMVTAEDEAINYQKDGLSDKYYTLNEVYEMDEEVLLAKLLTSNYTLSEKEAKILITEYLIDLSKDNNKISSVNVNQVIPVQQQRQSTIIPQRPTTEYPYPKQTTRPPDTLIQVDKLIQQIFRLNITGVLNQSVSIAKSDAFRTLGNGIFKLVFCDPLSRVLGRCRGNDTIGRFIKNDLKNA